MGTIYQFKKADENETRLQRGTRIIDLYGNEAVVKSYIPGNRPIENIGGAGIIYAGGGHVDIIYIDGTMDQKIPEAIVLSKPWQILDGLAGEDEIQTLETEALEKLQKEEADRKSADKKRCEAIEKGRPIIKNQMPKWAKAVIVACYEVDKSDSYSDYHGVDSGPEYILAWSKHTRDLFSEMRKAAANFEETKHLSIAPDTNANGEKKTEDNKSYWHPADEHREKYSMGGGYYLKAARRYSSGWRVYKTFLDHSRMDWLYHAAGSGRYMVKADLKQSQSTKQKNEAITIARNEKRKGIEISFPSKPADSVIEALKTNGFRFHRKKALWYAKYNDRRMQLVQSIAAGKSN